MKKSLIKNDFARDPLRGMYALKNIKLDEIR